MSVDLPCHRTLLALPWLLNGTLEQAERREAREHLIACASCRAELVRTREALALFRAASDSEASTAPTRAMAPGRRFVVGSVPVLRRLAVAAAVAGLIVAGGRLWLLEGPQPSNRAPAAVARQGSPTPQAPAVAAQATMAPAAPAVGAAAVPRTLAGVAEPQGRRSTLSTVEQPRAEHPRRSTAGRRSAARTVISSISFEQGALAAMRVEPAKPATSQRAPISAIGFESGLPQAAHTGTGR